MEDRKEYAFLLMGQGGSGKTAIVQEIVLPAVDFIFPPEQPNESSSIIVCSSWAQAQNISTDTFKAVSCHNATCMRVQSYRNKDMLPETKQAALEAKLNAKRALVIEEVSMISPALYNMILYRFYHGRKKKAMAGDAGTTLCAAQVGLRTDAFEIAPGGFLATSSHRSDVSPD